jgi:serine/threonine protein kinase
LSNAASVIPLTRPVAQQPRRFGKYHLVQKLAEGGMAEIFLAKHIGAQGFERDVVVKCMHEHFSSSHEFVEMFLDEAKLAARLFHPNLVQITDLGFADDRYFICMEYLPGEDLQRIIDRSRQRAAPIAVSIAAKIILAACEGLEFAHSYQEGGKPANLVHRDVSPSNIIVTYQGQVKVVDFGIAKASSKIVHTLPGTVKGKLGYMSPEQAKGEPLDGRSDVFSLGVTFHELLTGQRVFEKDNEVSVLMALLSQPIPLPSSVRPDVSPDLEAIVMRAVEKDRTKRYPSAAALRDDLGRYLTGSISMPGMNQVAAFMYELFGPEQAARRTQIPTLSELAAKGYVLPTEDHSETPIGFERTMVRSSDVPTAVATPPGTRSSESTEHAPTVVERRRPRTGRAVATLLGALVLGGAVGGALHRAGIIELAFLSRVPFLAPPASAPTEVAPPAPASVSATPSEPAVPAPGPDQPDDKQDERTRPVPSPSRPVLLGMKDVSAAMLKRRAGIVGCGENNRAEIPPDRRVVIRMRIEPTGSVGVNVISPGVETTALGACLVKQLRQIKFPKNRNDPALIVEFPLRFNQG